jgi:large subunit ribosomal protein L4
MLAKILTRPNTLASLQRCTFASTFRSVEVEDAQSSEIAPIRATPEQLIAQPWSTLPFKHNAPIDMPFFNMITGEFTGEVATLDPRNFNLPLRRDIIHNVNQYFNLKGKKTFKLAKHVGDVAGSGKKPFPQKGRGASRQGNRRAPQRAGGGVAHGPVPRDLSISINEKVRLVALRTMLAAKLYENRMIFIDTEDIEYPKTQLLAQIVKPFQIDKLTFVVATDPTNDNFERASGNIKNVTMKKPQSLHVQDLLTSDYIFITKQGLIDLEGVISQREGNLYRNRKMPSLASRERQQDKRNDSFATDLITPILEAE